MTNPDNRPAQHVLASVEIGGLEAIWVLAAHFYAVLVPLVLVFVTHHHWDYLVAMVHDPFLFYVAAVLLAAGSAFEVAQNTLDKWYLTSETASANGVGLCDMLAFWFVTAGQSVVLIALAGGAWWVIAIAAVAIVSFPICYLTQVAHFAAPSALGIFVAVAGYQAFGDPVIFLSIILGFATVTFFSALLRTGAQVLHGFTTVAASSGVWFLRWAIENSEAGTPTSWFLVGGVAAVTAGLLAIAWPFMIRLPVTERIIRPVA